MNLKERKKYRIMLQSMPDTYVTHIGFVKIFIENGKLKARSRKEKPVTGVLQVVDLVGTYNNYTKYEAMQTVECAIRRVLNGRKNKS